MSLTVQIFEEYGAPTDGRGTSIEVTGVNWMDSGNATNPYHLYPLRRPDSPTDLKLSYKKYNYIKISGQYSKIKRAKLIITPGGGVAGQAANTALYYKFTNTYQQPDNNWDGEMLYVGTDDENASYEILLPLSTSPTVYTPYIDEHTDANVTLYSPFIVTQLAVKPSKQTEEKLIMNDVGNTVGFTFNYSFVAF